MKYDANMVVLTKEEIKEFKETHPDNLVALRNMIECGKYEMTWSQFTSILFVFFMNRSTKQIIFRKKLFPDRLYAYLQCKHEDEDLDGFYKVI